MRCLVSIPAELDSPVTDAISPVSGATERIASLRNRYRQNSESIALYEEKVAKQQARLDRLNKGSDFDSQSRGEDDEELESRNTTTISEPTIAEDDLRLEEQEIKELELKKRILEERVTGMEKDLSGLR